MVRYRIHLTSDEVEQLNAIISEGSQSIQTFRNANILLNCDEGPYSDKLTDEEISRVLKVGMRTIDRVKKKFVEQGMEACFWVPCVTRQ